MVPSIVLFRRLGEVEPPAERVFALIADPSRQPEWDGNDNLDAAESGQRVRAVGDVFRMTLTGGEVRENHVVEFVEGRLIAWNPAEPGRPPVGHLWRWQIDPIEEGRSMVVHTYDWTELEDPGRFKRCSVPPRAIGSRRRSTVLPGSPRAALAESLRISSECDRRTRRRGRQHRRREPHTRWPSSCSDRRSPAAVSTGAGGWVLTIHD